MWECSIDTSEYTSVASSIVFVSTVPVWVALLSPLLLNERLRQAAIVGLLILVRIHFASRPGSAGLQPAE
jgi:drug/metabolite transporter (DMT)-like permease